VIGTVHASVSLLDVETMRRLGWVRGDDRTALEIIKGSDQEPLRGGCLDPNGYPMP